MRTCKWGLHLNRISWGGSSRLGPRRGPGFISDSTRCTHLFLIRLYSVHPLRHYILDSTGLTLSTMADEAITNPPLYSMTADDAMDTSKGLIALQIRPSPAPPSELPLTSIGMSQKFSPQSEVCNPDWIRRACLNPHNFPLIPG